MTAYSHFCRNSELHNSHKNVVQFFAQGKAKVNDSWVWFWAHDKVAELKAMLERAQSDLETMPMEMKAEPLEEDDAFQDMVQSFAVDTAENPMVIDDSEWFMALRIVRANASNTWLL